MFTRLKLILRGLKELLIDKSQIAHEQMSKSPPVRMENGTVLLKSFGELIESDFKIYPVWVMCHIIDYDQPWYNQTNEETYRPWTGEIPVTPQSDFLAKAVFSFKDGTTYNGFTAACNNLDYTKITPSLVNATLFNKDRQESFWRGGLEIKESDINDFYFRMGKTSQQVFPIQYAVKQELVTESINGEIIGFMGCDYTWNVHSKQ